MIDVEIRKERPSGDGYDILNNTGFKWPTSWDELSPEQLTKIAGILISNKSSIEKNIDLFLAISEVDVVFIKIHLSEDDFKFQLVDALLPKFMEDNTMNEGVLRDVIPGYTGMDKRMKNFTWAQYCLVDAFFEHWQNGNPKLLDTVCALIYTQDGEAFSGESADDYLPMWSEKPLDLKSAIALHYGAMKKCLPKLYPKLFKKPAIDESMPEIKKKPKAIDYRAITINLSGGPFGTREQLDREPFHNVMKYLEMQAEIRKKSN